VLAIATGLAAGSACRGDAPRPAERGGAAVAHPPAAPNASSLDDLGRRLGVTFPRGSRIIGVERERGIDDLVAAKVEIRSAELSSFLASSPVKAADLQPGERGMLGPDHDWWDPGKATRLRTGQAALAGARYLNIGVDDGRPGVAVLYIVNHGT